MKDEILNKIFEGLTPESVFEVGCSDGALLEQIGNHFGAIKLGGIDKNREDMDKTNSRLAKWQRELYHGDVRNVPWPVPSKGFDVVFTLGLLMYVRNPLSVIQEMLHLAKNTVILVEPIYTESGFITDTATGLPFDSYGERFNHDYLAALTGAGIQAKSRKMFKDKIIFII